VGDPSGEAIIHSDRGAEGVGIQPKGSGTLAWRHRRGPAGTFDNNAQRHACFIGNASASLRPHFACAKDEERAPLTARRCLHLELVQGRPNWASSSRLRVGSNPRSAPHRDQGERRRANRCRGFVAAEGFSLIGDLTVPISRTLCSLPGSSRERPVRASNARDGTADGAT
jgi:hypothetical protein